MPTFPEHRLHKQKHTQKPPHQQEEIDNNKKRLSNEDKPYNKSKVKIARNTQHD